MSIAPVAIAGRKAKTWSIKESKALTVGKSQPAFLTPGTRAAPTALPPKPRDHCGVRWGLRIDTSEGVMYPTSDLIPTCELQFDRGDAMACVDRLR